MHVAGAGRPAWLGGMCRRWRSRAAAKPWGTCCRAPSGCVRLGTGPASRPDGPPMLILTPTRYDLRTQQQADVA